MAGKTACALCGTGEAHNHGVPYWTEVTTDPSFLHAIPPPEDPFTQRWNRLHARMAEIRAAKRNDYTGDDPDNLANYRSAAALIGVSVEALMLSRIQEKVTRAGVLLQGTESKVLDEKLEDTLVDIANIALLIGAELVEAIE